MYMMVLKWKVEEIHEFQTCFKCKQAVKKETNQVGADSKKNPKGGRLS